MKSPYPRRTTVKDETGKRYGKLTVLGRAGSTSKASTWHVRCDCGTEYVAQASNLRTAKVTQCWDCGRRESGKKRRKYQLGDFSVAELAAAVGVPPIAIYSRLQRGWTVEELLAPLKDGGQ